MEHAPFIHRCLALASEGRRKVGNGALVGAALVRNGEILAEAFHGAYGGQHAERALLEGYSSPIQPEDILYVNLEPCCHHGKTPPCTQLIIERHIRTVVYGMQDPDSRVGGRGVQDLQKAGVEVIGPLERSLCEYFNRGFLSLRTKRRPYVTLKMAKDRAGKISKVDGKPLKITSADQDAWSHEFLRSCHDAILCGVGTILSDNPLLNIRFDQKGYSHLPEGLNGNKRSNRNFIEPYKVVLDPSLRVNPDVKVIAEQPERLILCISEQAAAQQNARLLQDRGVRVCPLPVKDSLFDWDALWRVLVEPQADFHGITSVIVEGGQRTWNAFRAAAMIDEEVTLIGQGP